MCRVARDKGRSHLGSCRGSPVYGQPPHSRTSLNDLSASRHQGAGAKHCLLRVPPNDSLESHVATAERGQPARRWRLQSAVPAPSRCSLPLPEASFSFVLIHCMALAEILVPKFLSNGEGAPPCGRQGYGRGYRTATPAGCFSNAVKGTST